VKHTEYGDWLDGDERFDDIIQNGVKHTVASDCLPSVFVEDTIENGVKETKTPGADGDIIGAADFMSDNNTNNLSHLINDVIEHGVKLTNSSLQIDGSCVVEDVIQNGIKETHDDVYHHKGRVDDVIRNGIKETLSSIYPIERVVEKVIEVGVLEVKPAYQLIYNPTNFQPVMLEDKRIADVRNVILDGIKEVKELPDQSGELRGYGDYYHRQEDRTKPFTKTVDDVIRDGIKETKPMDEWVNTTNIVGKVISEGTSI
jgi:predicted peroxiredoxin